MRHTHRLIPGLLAGSLLIGGASGVFAAQGKAHTKARVGFATGQVSNLSATGFTLTRAPKVAKAGVTPKTFQVSLGATGPSTGNASAKEHARKGTTGALANGEFAFVVGQKTATGVTAQRVVYSAKRFNVRRLIAQVRAHRLANRLAKRLARRSLRHNFVRGTVNASSTAGTLSITTKKGKTFTFAIGTTTKYRVNKQLSTTPLTFTTGEKVVVRFARNGKSHTMTARAIIVPMAHSKG